MTKIWGSGLRSNRKRMGFMFKQTGIWLVVLPFWSENVQWPAVISSSAGEHVSRSQCRQVTCDQVTLPLNWIPTDTLVCRGCEAASAHSYPHPPPLPSLPSLWSTCSLTIKHCHIIPVKVRVQFQQCLLASNLGREEGETHILEGGGINRQFF
jgi:hypothetical protein